MTLDTLQQITQQPAYYFGLFVGWAGTTAGFVYYLLRLRKKQKKFNPTTGAHQ